ncbi:exodeoxyribonuclease V subunit gamma [Pasteurellaceae bacterium 22721_9_1]
MFKVYHSNDLDVQKDILNYIIESAPLQNAFEPETILVQSPGMAQWLQLKLAEKNGIAANFRFPMPASFIWQQYVDNLPNVLEQAQFSKEAMAWRLMRLIQRSDFQPILHYLHCSKQSEQQKLYQLACKIADLFDQYLVYRPNWILAWEQGNDNEILAEIIAQHPQADEKFNAQIWQDIQWQGQLWRALLQDISGENQLNVIQHRANLHTQYISLPQYHNLPKRLFIFGISALPKTYLETFEAISQHCDVHLFFNNPSEYYWGDIIDDKFAQQLRLKQLTDYKTQAAKPLFTETQLQDFSQGAQELTAENEHLLVGHPLLASWGKLGRDFFYLLSQLDTVEIQSNRQWQQDGLLSQLKHHILQLKPSEKGALHFDEMDKSISFNACHSPMREVEVLHDYLLQCFQESPDLTPKDIVVMVSDIDRYAPYIQAVFGRYQQKIWSQQHQEYRYDHRYIPFSISDEKLSESEILLATFLNFLRLKESQFSAENVLELLDIPSIRTCFDLDLSDLEYVRHWVEQSGIRFGLNKSEQEETNYNSWQAGLERMLLGFAMREENGIWQEEHLGFDASYGLKSRLTGALSEFIEKLMDWHQKLQAPHCIEKWQQYLTALLTDFFAVEDKTADIFRYIQDGIQQITDLLQQLHFDQPIEADVLADALTTQLNDNKYSLKFLVGRVSFCTLLPMRAIPFKVVCLLGMNERDYPRQQTPNSFDLMQYHHQKGDRSRRDDDRYLFLEALLSADERLYISYVGQSIIDNSLLEPSVLVNQLLDYLYDNLDALPSTQHKGQKALVNYHAMTAFSPKNFSENHRTFAYEWEKVANSNQSPVDDFIQPIEEKNISEEVIEIQLDQLIKFVQNPIKFFFEQQLGAYFRCEDEEISDTENFTLQGLDLYQIRQALLQEENIDEVFAQLKLKGTLPRGEFAQVYIEKVRSEIMQFRSVLADYLDKQPASEYIELNFLIDGKNVVLKGYLENLFDVDNQRRRITWRMASHKDSYLIENWLYFLVQAASLPNSVLSPLFYAREKDSLVGKYFEMSDEFDPHSLLKTYLAAYLHKEQKLTLVVTSSLKDCLAKNATEESYIKAVNQLAYGNEYSHYDKDPYWRRLLKQTQDINQYLPEIMQQTTEWFALMYNSVKKM